MEKQCRVCGVVFNVRPSHSHLRFCCGKKCGSEYQKTSLKGSGNPHYKNLPPKICLVCKSEFHSYNKKTRYCSKPCAGRSVENIKKLRIMTETPKIKKPRKKRLRTTSTIKYISCLKCSVVFVLPIKRHRNHCVACHKYGKTKRVCGICSKDFKSYNKKITCSKKCYSVHLAGRQLGEKSHRWEGGKTSEALIIRGSLAYKQWRDCVFARDNYTCQECGQRGGKLNADHIKSFSEYPELRLDISNGRTLCFTCHTKTPNFARKEQWAKIKKSKANPLPLMPGRRR